MKLAQSVVTTGLVLVVAIVATGLAACSLPPDQAPKSASVKAAGAKPAETKSAEAKPAEAKAAPAAVAKAGSLAFRSRAFGDGASIPARYSCDGLNLSPELSWTGAPAKTQSFVLIVEDPDAPGGTFIHWVFFDIAGKLKGLPEGQPATKLGLAGINDFGQRAWGGPCPPKGKGVHRYFFKLHAVDLPSLGLKPGASLPQLQRAMNGHILATAQIIGRFGR